MSDLSKALNEVRTRIAQATKRGLNEQNTKATLIEPILRVLGWNVEDVDEVQREYRIKTTDKPVDYGLLDMRTPRLFIEAKALGKDLNDRRWANQIMGYASVAGVEWIVLTDGDEYRIYNSHAPVAVEEKLFRTVRVTDDDQMVLDTLELLSKSRMAENRIEILWRAQFVDRQVQAALEQLFSPDSDMLLVNYVSGKTKNLTAAEIRASLVRCQMSLDFPVQTDVAPIAKSRRSSRKSKVATDPVSAAAKSEVSLTDLIVGGLIAPPAQLSRIYKGNKLTASIDKNGRVQFGKDSYDSLSTAAGAARATMIGLRKNGRVPSTNGWTFWKIPDQDGKLVPVNALRLRYLARGDSEAAG